MWEFEVSPPFIQPRLFDSEGPPGTCD
eukprot:COSAG01_NODE_61696_length_288_cov_0.825397_1_plen_26_part_10